MRGPRVPAGPQRLDQYSVYDDPVREGEHQVPRDRQGSPPADNLCGGHRHARLRRLVLLRSVLRMHLVRHPEHRLPRLGILR
jgi:hypothetical protein